MKKIELVLEDELNKNIDTKWDIYPDSFDGNRGIKLFIDENQTLEEALEDKSGIIEIYENQIEFEETELFEDRTEEEQQNLISKYKEELEEIKSLEENVVAVKLRFKHKDELEFIKNNPFLKNKKIIIDIPIKTNDYDKVVDLLEKYNEYKDSIYFPLDNNENYISLVDCMETVNYVGSIVEKINSLNLSPIESIMYAYDIVRNRVYTKENEDEDTSVSRDLTSVIKGDKIVCAGYSHLFDAIVSSMGYTCVEVSLLVKEDENIGHRRNMVYVQDDKYDLDGVYYFDTTFDCKQDDQVNEFLNEYVFFARTRNQINYLDRDRYRDKDISYYKENMAEEVEKLIDEVNLDKIRQLCIPINRLGRFLGKEDILDFKCFIPSSPFFENLNKEEIIENIKDIDSKYNKPISALTYLEILSNVRKVQHQEDPEFYPYSIDSLYETCKNSGWRVVPKLTEEQLLLFRIFGMKEPDPRKEFAKIVKEKGIKMPKVKVKK